MIVIVTVTVPPAGPARYAALLRTPHVRRLFLSGLVARLPTGMVPLALLLAVRADGGSYAAAGAVSGAYFVASAIGAPFAGSSVDRRGATRVLLPRAALYTGGLLAVCALFASDAPLPLVAVTAAGAGALVPPVAAALRVLWPRLFTGGELRATAYALEASLQEIFFVVGPLLVALLAAAASPVAALLVAAAAGGVGTTLVALAPPVRAWLPEEERHASSFLGALGSAGVRTIVLVAAGLGLAFGTTEVAFPAFAELHGGVELGSIPIALFAAGSLVGGLVAGALDLGAPRAVFRRATLALTAGMALPLLATSLPALAVLAFLAGLPIAPLIMSAYSLTDAVARRGTAAEAFAWIGTAVATGLAAGAAAGGALVDAYGVRAALALGVAMVATGAVLARTGPGLGEGES